MSNGTVIKEGNVGRKFYPVNKLQINNQGGTTSLWRPVVNMDSKNITENGLYLAKQDSLYAYDEVKVNVTMLSEAEKKMGKTITGIDPTTGNPVSVGVDDDGNLTEETIPDHIHIQTPPTKKNYTNDEIINFSGIEVYLKNSDNTTFTNSVYSNGKVSFNELTFPVTVAQLSDSKAMSSDLETVLTQPIKYITFPVTKSFSNDTYYGTYTLTAQGNDLASANLRGIVVRVQNPSTGKYSYSLILASKALNVSVKSYTEVYKKDTGTPYRNYEKTISIYSNYPYDRKTVYYSNYVLASSYISDFDSSIGDNLTWNQLDYSKTYLSPRDAWTVQYGANEGSIPVQWIRSDGKTLSDTFNIKISSN